MTKVTAIFPTQRKTFVFTATETFVVRHPRWWTRLLRRFA